MTTGSSTYTPQTAPRTIEELEKISAFQLRTLLNKMGCLNTPENMIAWNALPSQRDKAKFTLEYLKQYDAANGAPPQVQTTMVAPSGPAPMAGPPQSPLPMTPPPGPQPAPPPGAVTPVAGGYFQQQPPMPTVNGHGPSYVNGQLNPVAAQAPVMPMSAVAPQQVAPVPAPGPAVVDPSAAAAAATAAAPATTSRKREPKTSTAPNPADANLGVEVLNLLNAIKAGQELQNTALSQAREASVATADLMTRNEGRLGSIETSVGGLSKAVQELTDQVKALGAYQSLVLRAVVMILEQQNQTGAIEILQVLIPESSALPMLISQAKPQPQAQAPGKA